MVLQPERCIILSYILALGIQFVLCFLLLLVAHIVDDIGSWQARKAFDGPIHKWIYYAITRRISGGGQLQDVLLAIDLVIIGAIGLMGLCAMIVVIGLVTVLIAAPFLLLSGVPFAQYAKWHERHDAAAA